MKSKIIDFAALFLLALVTGVFWETWFTLTRSIETFSAAEFIHIGKTIIANVAVPMRILMRGSFNIGAGGVKRSRYNPERS